MASSSALHGWRIFLAFFHNCAIMNTAKGESTNGLRGGFSLRPET